MRHLQHYLILILSLFITNFSYGSISNIKGIPARGVHNYNDAFDRFYIDLGLICKHYNLHYVIYTPKKRIQPYKEQKITPKIVFKDNNLHAILDIMFKDSNLQYLKLGRILMIYAKETPTKTIMNVLNAKLFKIRKHLDYTFEMKNGFVFKVNGLYNDNIFFKKLQGTFRENLLQSLNDYPNIVGTKIGEYVKHRVPVISYIKFNTLFNNLLKQKIKKGKMMIEMRRISFKTIKRNAGEKFWFSYFTEFYSEMVISWLSKKEWHSTKIKKLLRYRAEILSKYKNWRPILQKNTVLKDYMPTTVVTSINKTKQNWRIKQSKIAIPTKKPIILQKEIDFPYYPHKMLKKKVSIYKYTPSFKIQKLISKNLFDFRHSFEVAYYSYLSQALQQSGINYNKAPKKIKNYATFLYSIETTCNKIKTKIILGYSPDFYLKNNKLFFYEHFAFLQFKHGRWEIIKEFNPNEECTILLENISTISNKNKKEEMEKALDELVKKLSQNNLKNPNDKTPKQPEEKQVQQNDKEEEAIDIEIEVY